MEPYLRNIAALFFLLFFCISWTSSRVSRKKKDILDNLLLNYDSSLPPNYETDSPTHVDVQVYIHSLDSFSENTMDFSTTLFLRQKWQDGRLNYTSEASFTYIEIDTRVVDRVWVPDLYFWNEKSGKFHHVTLPNRLMHLYRNGTIFYSARISLVLTCQMNLMKYPLDSQTCPIYMESYSYSTENVMFHWYAESPIDRDKQLELPQFHWVGTTTTSLIHTYGSGNFTRLCAYLYLMRDPGYHVIQTYIPSILIVILSWVSFWITADAVPARISLGVLTVLTMSTQISGLQGTLPKVSYVKAVDVWLSTCLCFVFAALLEFACVNVLIRRSRGSDIIDLHKPHSAMNGGSAEVGKVRHQQGAPVEYITNRQVYERARSVDKHSRLLFPIAFVIFNIVYWTFYDLWQDDATITNMYNRSKDT